jgi:gamma-glutamyltranspeptidase
MALNNLEVLDPEGGAAVPWGSRPHLHARVEAVRLAFADVLRYNADPAAVAVPVDGMLAKDYAAARCRALHPSKVAALEGHLAARGRRLWSAGPAAGCTGRIRRTRC